MKKQIKFSTKKLWDKIQEYIYNEVPSSSVSDVPEIQQIAQECGVLTPVLYAIERGHVQVLKMFLKSFLFSARLI